MPFIDLEIFVFSACTKKATYIIPLLKSAITLHRNTNKSHRLTLMSQKIMICLIRIKPIISFKSGGSSWAPSGSQHNRELDVFNDAAPKSVLWPTSTGVWNTCFPVGWEVEIWDIWRSSQHLYVTSTACSSNYSSKRAVWQGASFCWKRPPPLGNIIAIKGCTPTMFR